MGVKNFCTKLSKGTSLRQTWSNKSFGVCGTDVLTLGLYGDERKKVHENHHWKIESSITLRRYRDVVIIFYKERDQFYPSPNTSGARDYGAERLKEFGSEVNSA